MKRALLAAVAAISFGCAGHALASESGYIGASYSSIDLAGSDVDLTTVQAVGSWNLSPNYELQLDGSYNDLLAGGDHLNFTSATVHVFRATKSYKAGVFVGGLTGDTADTAGLGLEGRYFVNDNISLGGSLAFAQINGGFGSNVDLRGANVTGSYFFSDQFRLDAGISAAQLEFLGTKLDFNTYSAGLEYQFAKRWSGTLDYAHTDLDSGFGGADIDTVQVGLRWTFGGSLKDRDRNSAPFGGFTNTFGSSFPTAVSAGFGGFSGDNSSCPARLRSTSASVNSCNNDD